MENQTKQTSQSPTPAGLLKKRKFYLAVPVLILPFLTMAFWALGGGKDTGKSAAAPSKGLNMALPSAQFKDKPEKDKMAIYRSAAKDTSSGGNGVSKSFIQAMGFTPETAGTTDKAKTTAIGQSAYSASADLQSSQITAKLAQINRQLNQPAQQSNYSPATADPQVSRLDKMMKRLNTPPAEDPEMKQLDQMLSKIQAIQNPEPVKPTVSPKEENDSAFSAIPAVVDGRQKVINGGTVRLKLTDTVSLKGILLPRGQLLFGACQVTNQRLLLHIQNIRIGKSILPADLTVFSLDGMPGIPAPEAELGEAAGSGAGNAIAGMQFLGMDQSLGTQAAAGGINAAKGLFSRKVKKIRVKLEDNFAVLLRDNTHKK